MNRAATGGAQWGARLTRDKSNTLLLIGAALMVLLPHAAHLPLWVVLVCGATLAWRATLTFRGLRLPPPLLLLPVAAAAMAAVLREYHTLLGRDAGVAMLTMLVAFKMLEMHAKRDLFVVLYLCMFIMLTSFLYSQSMGTALLIAAALVLLLTAQMSFQFTGALPPLARRLRMSATMLAWALPVALLLFIAFPRIQGPLWGLPNGAGAGHSGLTDQMAPGMLSSLAMSDEPAFRVRFLDPVPPQASLYWRAVVLGSFDGTTWARGVRAGAGQVTLRASGAPVRQQITIEPQNNPWVFALDLPGARIDLPGHGLTVTSAIELTAERAASERLRYDAVSYPAYQLEPDHLSARGQWLQLPPTGNARTRAWGAELAQLPDPLERSRAVLRRLRTEPYRYTLQPPLLEGPDSIDQFLFRTRAGFCEHYAGAFVFLMRAAGVPARVVTGYQGGEMNPVDNYLTVRQSDAHAWAEIWIADRGWLRVDPTAAVSPDRVEHNLARTFPAAPPFGIEGLGELLSLRDPNSPLAHLRFELAALANGWNQWVLNYTPARQRAVMGGVAAALGNARAVGAALATAALLWLLRWVRQRTAVDPVERLYLALCAQLAQRGLARAPHEGPHAYAARVAASELPGRASVLRFLALYGEHKYAPPDPARAADLPRTLGKLLRAAR